MKLKLTTILCALLITYTVRAQWVQTSNFPGPARARSTAFTIGGKIYVMGGYANTGQALNDFWEYDIANATWSQKPNFPGEGRYGAVSFVIGSSGYIATGANDNGYLDDLWQYNTITDSWSPEVGLPASQPQHENQRTEAFAFVIGQKAYLGGGEGWVFGANNTNNYTFPDLWEYDPNANTWTPKAGFPDFVGRDMAVAGVINNKAYVGLGCNVAQTTDYSSFWEYDATTDQWTARAAFPTVSTTDALSFVFDSSLYVVGGVNLNPISLSNQCYKYEPATDSWTQAGSFTGGAIAGGIAAANDSVVFAGTGFTASLTPRKDLWKFPSSGSTTSVAVTGHEGKKLSIYPNPAGDRITISCSQKISSAAIYDMTGKLILRNDNSSTDIDVKALNAGVYNLTINYADGTSGYGRLIKD